MARITTRALAFFLTLVTCASLLLTLPVFAESGVSEPTATLGAQEFGEGDARFIFDTLTSQKEKTYETGASPVTLSLAADDAAFTAGSVSLLATATNAFYLSLVNESSANLVRITYTYEENALEQTETLERTLTKSSSAVQSFVIKADHLNAQVKSITLAFHSDTGVSGNVTLQALFNLSAYFHEGKDEATLTRCHYVAQTQSVEIAGALDYDTTVLYAGKSLALFSLSDTEELHLSNKTPIAKTGVSFNFFFTVDATTSDAIFARYVVAAVSDQGEMIPLCEPRYPTVPSSLSGDESAFKGFHGGSLSTTLDVNPDVEIVDVYLDRMYGTQGNGILHAGEHAYYYFNTEYVGELDRTVRNLVGCGTHVYLRFLISGDANGLSYADYATADKGVVTKLPVVRSDTARYDLYAVVNFLTARYATESYGRISGVVLGRAADRSAVYSYAAVDSMASYVSLYAITYNLIANTTLRNVPDARIVLPVSDRIFNGYATKGQLEGDYYTTLFLPSLITALQANSLSPAPFTLMLTSETLPARVAENGGKTYGMEHLDAFMSEWNAMCATCPFLGGKIFYMWQTDAATPPYQLSAAYVALYLTLAVRGDVSTFVVDNTLSGDGATEALSYLAQYIDTDKFSSVTERAFQTLGCTVAELVPTFDVSTVSKRRYHYVTLTKGGFGVAPLGSYVPWRFATASDTLGWYGGIDCRDLAVQAETRDTRALTATLFGKGEYADIAYHWATPTDLSFAPYISLDLCVTGNVDTRYEIQLRLYGESDVTVSSAVVMTGKRETLCLDLTGTKTALSALRGMRITARPLDAEAETFTLSTYAITLGSDTLDDNALAERMAQIMQNAKQEQPDEPDKRDFTRPLIATIIVVLASGAVIALAIVRRNRKKQTKKKQSTDKKPSTDKKQQTDK